jgi:hypothetical protein
VDTSTTRKYGGAGLGLTTISARLVEMMCGTVRLESELGRGSEFSFTACLGGVDSKEAKVGTAFSLRDTRDVGAVLRVLLAEDNQVNHRLAARLLEKRGHRVSLAANGLEALENEGYDLVLMDLQMPEVDGFEATAAIRERERRSGEHQGNRANRACDERR